MNKGKTMSTPARRFWKLQAVIMGFLVLAILIAIGLAKCAEAEQTITYVGDGRSVCSGSGCGTFTAQQRAINRIRSDMDAARRDRETHDRLYSRGGRIYTPDYENAGTGTYFGDAE